mgnify:CR=1 FL=1
MGKNREFEVTFVGLKPGIHVFEYEIGDEFFTEKAGHPLSHLEAFVKMSLDKHSGFLMLKFEVGGNVLSPVTAVATRYRSSCGMISACW